VAASDHCSGNDPGDEQLSSPRSSVVIVTYQRAAYVGRCIDHLLAQTHPAVEIIVVDSSTDDETRSLVHENYPSVIYTVCAAGRGSTATARDIGFKLSSGEVLAFVDDDAFAEPAWLINLLAPFEDPTVGGVGGRQVRGVPGEKEHDLDVIGVLESNGVLIGNFSADNGKVIEVDHLLGANMAFRRSIIVEIGGIRNGYAGTCIHEESDLCLRVAHAGYRLLYTPFAVVEHVAAPYAKGRRFDLRYEYWSQHNHIVLLVRNFGALAPITIRYLVFSVGHDTARRFSLSGRRARSRQARGAIRAAANAIVRSATVVGATPVGFIRGIQLSRLDRSPH